MKIILMLALLWGTFCCSVQASTFSGSLTIGNLKVNSNTIDLASIKASTVIVELRETKDGITKFYAGAGIVIDKRHFLSVNHVISEQDNAADDNFYLANVGGTPWYAKAIKTDPAHDLALFEIDKNAPDLTVNPIKFADANIGDEIFTVGHPKADYYSISTGSVLKFHETGYKDIDCTMLRATITDGNSGGGVFNVNGELVGMSFSAPFFGGNLGYMITSQDIQNFLKEG